MLKTNSKKARKNVREYIRGEAEYIRDSYGLNVNTDAEIAQAILDIFRDETAGDHRRNMSEAARFEDWAQGLALGQLFTYYVHPAVPILGNILEETETERSKYTEQQAENLLTRLIYRELCAACGR